MFFRQHLSQTIITHQLIYLQVWNLKFPEEEQSTNLFGTTKKKSKGSEVIDNIFRHFAFGAEVQAGKPVRLRIGYNHMRRQELGVLERRKGFPVFQQDLVLILNSLLLIMHMRSITAQAVIIN
jgi:hypothetical protein